MRSADIDLNVGLDPYQTIPPSQSLLSFLCPQCHERLNVPSTLAGIAGPCPACAEVIRAPQSVEAASAVSHHQIITTSEIVLPELEQGWGEATPPLPRENVGSAILNLGGGASTVVSSGASGFSAMKRIAALNEDGLDDSWREKVERDRKTSRNRIRRDRFIDSFLMSRKAQKLRNIGLVAIAVILALTVMSLYANQRTGGALFKKIFGQ